MPEAVTQNFSNSQENFLMSQKEGNRVFWKIIEKFKTVLTELNEKLAAKIDIAAIRSSTKSAHEAYFSLTPAEINKVLSQMKINYSNFVFNLNNY